MKRLAIAKDLKLPLDVVTQTIAILAKRRAGKSYTMRRLVEQLLKAAQQVVLVDPKGDQWGLRFGADGKSAGLPVIILGGERGDVDLEAGAGEVVAKLVVEERVSVVLDLSLFRKHQVATFMTAFMESLYRLKAKEAYRTPMMLVIDEADAIAPQKPQKGEERMLGAAEDIVRRGGQRGIGCVLVSQRSAVLNKNVLTQAQMLVVLRTIAPQDLAAMKAWIDVHGDDEQGKTLMESLPSLPIGDAWFWSPGWPTAAGIFQRSHVLPIETFDSGKSPEPGSKPVEPKKAADVDLDALKRQMAATIEKQKADDPRELKKQLAEAVKRAASADGRITTLQTALDQERAKPRSTKATDKRHETIAELKGELAKYRRALEAAMKILVKVKAIDFDIENEAGRAALEQALAAAVQQVMGPIEKRVTSLSTRVTGIREQATAAEEAIQTLLKQKVQLDVQVESRAPFEVKTSTPARPPKPPREVQPPADGITRPQQRILDALAWVESMRLPTPRKEKVAFLSDASPTSSSFSNNLGTLRTAGYIDYPGPGLIALTDGGRAIAHVADDTPKTDDELQAAIYSKLPPAQVRILKPLVESFPEPIAKLELAERAEASATSSSFSNNLGSLRSLGLIDYPQQGFVSAKRELFINVA